MTKKISDATRSLALTRNRLTGSETAALKCTDKEIEVKDKPTLQSIVAAAEDVMLSTGIAKLVTGANAANMSTRVEFSTQNGSPLDVICASTPVQQLLAKNTQAK